MHLTLETAKTPAERRAAILALEAAARALPQDPCPLRHHFAPGQYAREIFMAAGKTVVGKIHLHAHMNVVSKGRAQVFTEGRGMELIEAGDTWVSEPGTKRTVYVIEDMLWTTVHANPTDSRDIPWLESQLVVDTYEQLGFADPLKVAA